METRTDNQEFLVAVRDLWGQGLTQQEVANRLGMSIGGVAYRLRINGYKFGRLGLLIPIHPTQIVEKPQAEVA